MLYVLRNSFDIYIATQILNEILATVTANFWTALD